LAVLGKDINQEREKIKLDNYTICYTLYNVGGSMALMLSGKRYKPAEVSRILSEEFGHKVTPSVIRKWDNCIFSFISEKRGKGVARNYTNKDIQVFNAIAVLRNLGYSLEETKNMMTDIVMRSGNSIYLIEVKNHIDKQKKGWELFHNLLKEKSIRK
jgi:DNA-binding transcriptional MerR regulator